MGLMQRLKNLIQNQQKQENYNYCKTAKIIGYEVFDYASSVIYIRLVIPFYGWHILEKSKEWGCIKQKAIYCEILSCISLDGCTIRFPLLIDDWYELQKSEEWKDFEQKILEFQRQGMYQ